MAAEASLEQSDFVQAVLYKIGAGYRIQKGEPLNIVLRQLAHEDSLMRIFFYEHPQYHDFPEFEDALGKIYRGGGIIFEGLTHVFSVQAHLAGPYGQRKYDSLPSELRTLAAELAARLKEANRNLSPAVPSPKTIDQADEAWNHDGSDCIALGR